MIRIVAVVCHGTAILPKTRVSTGKLLVAGKTWTDFKNEEERVAEAHVGRRIQPFWIEDEARRLEGTSLVTHGTFAPFAVRDGHLITGQQQFSGAAAADLVVQAPGR